VGLKVGDLPIKQAWKPYVIAIKQCYVLAAREAYTSIPGTSHAAVALSKVVKLACVLFQNSFKLLRVRRAVVDDNYFEVLQGLR
jgi:hypothetical protein